MKAFRLVPPPQLGHPGDPGLIGPGSIFWIIARERALVLGGPSALLLQVAHPLIAAGVAQHSTFQQAPLQRLMGTLEAVLVTTFGDTQQAHAMAAHVRSLHQPVHGRLKQAAGNWPACTPYSAFRPDLCLWVYATLIEQALNTYSALIRPLSFSHRALYYRESEPFGQLFGVTKLVRPTAYAEFRRYYDATIRQLVVGSTARHLATSIFSAKIVGLPVSPLAPIMASGLLPASVRQAYNLQPPGPAWRTLRGGLHRLIPATPPALRYWPHYHQALSRTASPA